VVVDEKLIRPAEVDLLVGDASKAHRELGWQPSVSFQGLVHLMVDSDLELVAEEIRHGAGSKPRITSIR
jgi:GDPmannose 4,6-dehydratase